MSDQQVERIRWSIVASSFLIVIIVTQFFDWKIWDAQIFMITGFLIGELWRLFNYILNRKKRKNE